ncbi:MAG: hypothetical protein A3C79_00270 [Candidatus Taylorbacteria bacterium RIFCSPHIGHO2_02_FULL_45_28]|uniref:Uncharacterized protein n=1 Tax=Candidatus Taylorbacteria bacterium RIFCSPHIGHO2_12_FULL_45_16 TaxID=1802315 RepID=A0A1G2N146_9BACT|nr:MAG: hypothetical protein A2830_01525 [Candidatus Taylorbacteria bacterium RIFCSPHIGHO2_01_FULL_44_110]OHA25462.1 MAG: hypothetical protein A3C79_00270 [Candidatus Taylorbacteria bacterium RIFCSPHIGHO2_02_FULL_45_28]OHA29129.1 MAG: hypothetical protein A3F51_00735 [Candidatus Taylorbacteria bacterium RIFCSPHIGHO2_12_FULL_45_16]OHA33351.1 MAG: hypothetical protein A3A23_01615 [Candidatus Taylorbacteria bacterium RIFCSPLOWO2_01_FULL_45_59]OHA38737.1 MAG: hypothetical protein A3I98_03490 [Candi
MKTKKIGWSMIVLVCITWCANLAVIAGPNDVPPLLGDEGVRIFSGPALQSTNTPKFRLNTMAWLRGIVSGIPMDRASDPAAVHPIPENGLQWFDFITTTNFNSWMGTTTFTNSATAAEKNHRVIVAAFGNYPVSDYWCRISSTLTNFVTTLFNVATNTTTHQPNPFSINFVGVDYGPNGQLESYPDPSIGNWVVGGDDRVFSNGEDPSTNTYTRWFRFGATAVINVGSTEEFNGVKSQFVSGLQSFTAELIKGGVVIDSKTVEEEKPTLHIEKYGDNSMIIGISGGQLWMNYKLLAATNLSRAPFLQFYSDSLHSGQSILMPITSDPERYFRLLTVMSP